MEHHEGMASMSEGDDDISDVDDQMDDNDLPRLKRKVIGHSDKERDECGEMDDDIRTQQHLQLLRQAEAAAFMGLQQPFGFPPQFHTSLQAQFQAQLQAFAQQQQSFGNQSWMTNGQAPPPQAPNPAAALYAQSLQAQIARNQGTVLPPPPTTRPPDCSPISQNNGSGEARSEPSSSPSPRSLIGSSAPVGVPGYGQIGNRSFGSRSSPRPSLTPSPSNESPQNDTPRAAGGSSQQSWTFEEQFKQLYELTDDPKRKAFLDELFDFMQKRGTPITRLPIMAKHVLDLYELYNLVVARGGLVDVINKKLWQEIIKGLNLPSSITSAAFTLRTQYMKYLYPFECEKDKFSTPPELQTAIDGNRREGRRSSYGAFGEMGGPRGPGMPLGGGLGQLASQMQMSPLSLVSRQPLVNGGGQHQHHHVNRGSPPSAEALQALEMQRLNLWNLYSSALSGDVTNTTEQPSNGAGHMAALAAMAGGRFIPQQKEALNLAAEQARQDALKFRTSEYTERQIKVEEPKREQPNPKPVAEKREPEEPRLSAEEVAMKKRREIHWRMAVTEGKDNETNEIQITVTSRGVESRNGAEGQLIATFQFDGVVYQGPLFAQASQGRSASTV